MRRNTLLLIGVGVLLIGTCLFVFLPEFLPESGHFPSVQADGTDEKAPAQSSDAASPQGDPSLPTVLVGKVEERPLITLRKYVGGFEPIQEVDVVSRVTGYIEKQLFKEGNLVKPDTILFEMEKIRYEAAYEAAVAKVVSCEAQIATTGARLKQVEARLLYAQNNYNRNKELFEQGGNLVTKDTVENIKSVLDAQLAEMAAAKADELAAKAGLDAAKAELKLAKDDLEHTTVRAMITGRVGRVNYTVGNYVTPQSGTMVSIVQMDPIYLRFSMSEKDFTLMFGNVENLKKTATVRIELANGKMYDEPGTISFIDNQMVSTTNTINIWATFANTREYLNPGGVATVYLAKNEEKKLPAVRESAVMFDGRHHSVYVVGKDNVIEKRLIEPASSSDGFQSIFSGVKVGETIVIDGTHKIRLVPGPDGKIMPVKVNPSWKPTLGTETTGGVDGSKDK